MNLQGILNLAHKRLFDEKGVDAKRLFADWELASYASDAEKEIARELECLRDSDTIGYLTLDGTSGQINSVSVSTIVITSAAVPFAANLTTTAANLAANINAHTSEPKYRAVARGSLVIIKTLPNTGYPAGGYSLAASATTMTAAATNLPGLCRHVVAIGQRYLPLDERILRITRFKPSTQTSPITLATREYMDDMFPGWETYENGTITYGIPEYESNELIISSPSDAVEMIEQGVIRLPLADLSIANPEAVPEVAAKYHESMVEWVMGKAYTKRDVLETFDPGRAAWHISEFNRRIAEWKKQAIWASPGQQVNSMPGGLM